MKFKPLPTFFALWLALAFASLSALRAQEAPPAPPAPAAPKEAPADQPVAKEEEKPAVVEPPAEPAATAAETKKADGELRELGTDDDKGTPAAKKKSGRKSRGIRIHSDGEPPFGDHSVSVGSKQEEAVSLFGNSTVDGEVTDAAVSIFGNTTVNGTAGDAAVSIFGTTTVNGTVHGEVVAVFGDVVLGPNAEVGDHVVVVFGKLTRASTAKIKGGVESIGSFGPFSDMSGFRQWVVKCLLWGRPLWIGEGLGWIWPVAFGFLVFYMFIALLFPRGIEKSAEILEQRPGGTILAALLTTLLTPVLIVLLCVTVVGIFLVPFLVVGLFFCTVFGKVAVHAWLGRRITGQFGDGPMKHVAVSVFFGGLIIMLLYLVPFLGFLLWKLFAVLGLGMIVYRLILSMQREKPARTAAAGADAGTAGSVPPVLAGATFPGATVASLPAVISASTLERAGFWRRIGATFLDFIMVGIILGMSEGLFHGIGFHPGRAMPLWFAVYHVIMWATKGTTIGGIICGLKVVRTDDRPVDWSVALVRGLSAFLSLAVAGLGFIWVAFDDEKQSWHDKIAGTTIVRVPKGTPLV